MFFKCYQLLCLAFWLLKSCSHSRVITALENKSFGFVPELLRCLTLSKASWLAHGLVLENCWLIILRDWLASLVTKSTGHSSWEPGFNSQRPQGSSQSVSPVAGNSVISSASVGARHIHGAQMYMQAKHSCTWNKIKHFKRTLFSNIIVKILKAYSVGYFSFIVIKIIYAWVLTHRYFQNTVLSPQIYILLLSKLILAYWPPTFSNHWSWFRDNYYLLNQLTVSLLE